MIGSTIGSYRVLEKLGEGGMGEVYRATDTRLGRAVAIKILPEAVARDPERIARFKREAQVLAALNHPHIAAIYGFEQSGDVEFLVLELAEGQTLADRLRRSAAGRMTVDEAVEIARQIAAALEAAHDKGIIHRDLKPANIALTAADQVKVLDFGLAKLLATEPADSRSGAATESPTLTTPAMMTGIGTILGTAAYMSPEQAKGRVADKRSDVWAFGCVLYEMLAGKRAFEGEDVSDTLAAVLRSEPDWSALPANLPAAIRALTVNCLQRDRARRVGDMAVVTYVLSAAHGLDAQSQPTPPPAPAVAWWVVAAVAVAAAAIASGTAWRLKPAPPITRSVIRFPITMTEDQSYASVASQRHMLALSPDGRRLAFVARNNQIYLRRMDQIEPAPLRVAEEQAEPFFSSDGQWLGYWSGGHLKKVSIAGGAPITLCDTTAPLGASWTGERVVFGTLQGVLEVPATGGTPKVLVPADLKAGERMHGPQILPGGDILITVGSSTTAARWSSAQIVVHSPKTGERRVLVRGGTDGHYLASGHLIYVRDGVLFANAFDVERGELRGGPVSIVEGIAEAVGGQTGSAQLAVSDVGSIAYLPAIAGGQTSVVWRDRQGNETPIPAPPHTYQTPRVSPDGTRIALHATDQDNDLWIWDSRAETLTRLTFDKGSDASPLWSRDSLRIAYVSTREGSPNLYWKKADGTGQPEKLLAKAPDSGGALVANAIRPDGKQLIYSVGVPSDIMALTIGEGDGRPLIAQTAFSERGADISPDGKWIAYYSDESGPSQVFVRPFPDVDSGRWQVSGDGGSRPRWNPAGKELFYVDGRGRLVSVSLPTGPSFGVGKSTVLFDLSDSASVLRNYDITPDGARFVVTRPQRARALPQIVFVENWFEELKQRVPAQP